MLQKQYQFSQAVTQIFFGANIKLLSTIIDIKKAIFLIDEQVFLLHQKKFKSYTVILLPSGEQYKNQATVDKVIVQLIEAGADRSSILVGVGGGVVTDMTGYIASIYLRGIRFGFVPTTLLSIVDASIGGKNGVDVGIYKNMVGVTRQPLFIIQDAQFLSTLPHTEWQSGFAEIIKHGCIKDAVMFKDLQAHDINYYRKKKTALIALMQRNAQIKLKVVQKDEFEQADRKLLNFGHTLGHAIENQYQLSHGQAIAIGMHYACKFSASLIKFKHTQQVVTLLEQYELPTNLSFDVDKVFQVLTKDKKKTHTSINYILLQKIGKGVIHPIDLQEVYQLIQQSV